MNRLKSYILSVLLLSIIWGCEQFLEVELPGQEPRLVMNALIEPSDTIKVFLTKSRSILEGREYDGFDYVKNGKVSLKTSSGTILPLTFVDKSNSIESLAYYYLAGYDFKVNERYEIFAESDGFKAISSQIQFPARVAIKEISYRNLGPDGPSSNQDLLEFTVKFDDLPGKNYYELKARYYGPSVTEPNSFFSGDFYPKPVNPAYERNSWTNSGLLFDDILLSGNNSEIVFRATIPRNYDLEVTINFSHVSESYYRYEETVGLQNYNRGDFLSQPVLVYTNIQNGMGILKARNTDTKILKILLED